MKTYYFLIGTIAEFIKVFSVMVEMDKRGLSYKIISTGQNKIDNTDLFDELKHKDIDYILNTQPLRQTTTSLFFWWIKTFFVGLSKFKKIKANDNYLIVHGDTISTFLGALLGEISGFKVVHIEAGLRSFNYLSPFPEEINRVLVSGLADIHFAPNSWALNNLNGKSGKKINTFSNTLIDSLSMALNKNETPSIKLPEKYFIFVFHRQENLADTNFVKKILDQIIKQANNTSCVFVAHGNTLHTLKSLPQYKRMKESKKIILLERVSYFKFVKILNGAEFLITDGGSNQEEAFYMGLPTLILRKNTERTEGLNSNVVLGGKDITKLNGFFENYRHYRKSPQKKDISPSKIIVDYLENTK